MTLPKLIEAESREEADKLFEAYVQLILENEASLDRDQAIKRARSNIGYFSGYYSREKQKRVEDLYGAVHPVFGPVGGPNEPKTPLETFLMGATWIRSESAAADSVENND